MTTTLTGYGGVGEIGGNKFLLEDRAGRIFFDFGKSFARYQRYFDGTFLSARPQRGLLDVLALEILPPLRGVLRSDLIPALDPRDLQASGGENPKHRLASALTLSAAAQEKFWKHWRRQFPNAYRDLRRSDAPAADLILLSHAHLDHIGDLAYVAPEIPVASTRVTAFISKVLLDAGQAGQSGAPSVRARTLNGDGLLQADGRLSAPVPRPWLFLDGAPSGERAADPLASSLAFWSARSSAGPPVPPPLRRLVEAWPVDHSLPGGVGFVVETEAGWVAYSGDIRLHGIHGARTQAFAERLAELRVTALLCEGTHLRAAHPTTEAQVQETCRHAVQQAEGQLVVADFAARNVERLLAFADIARQTDRCLLVQPKDAYLLRALHLAEAEAVPDWLTNPYVQIYADPKLQPAAWEQRVRERYRGSLVSPTQVQKRPGDYVLAFSLLDIADLLDLEFLMRRRPGGLYIFSNSPAYDDEQQADLVRLYHWTQRLGLTLAGLAPRLDSQGRVVRVEAVPGYHASGHAGGADLAAFVKTARPQTLIPIHTTTPQAWLRWLRGSGISVTPLRYGEPQLLADRRG